MAAKRGGGGALMTVGAGVPVPSQSANVPALAPIRRYKESVLMGCSHHCGAAAPIAPNTAEHECG